MSLVDHLFATRSPLELAKLAAGQAKEIAALKDRVHQLEHELFWVQAVERDTQQPKGA